MYVVVTHWKCLVQTVTMKNTTNVLLTLSTLSCKIFLKKANFEKKS